MNWTRAVVRALFWTVIVVGFVAVMGYVGYVEGLP